MSTVAIIGAGQLGSRHLQGVKLSGFNLDIWVSDPSEQSLEVAEERYNQVDAEIAKTAHFVTDINALPEKLDVVIVASSSKPRLSICKTLLNHAEVKYLVLEKFLFTSLKEYDEAEALFAAKGVKVWVNCPRRMFAYYDRINTILDKNEHISMKYEDSEWGMCCNSIHMIDIFMKLCGETTYSIDFSKVVQKAEESKRAGYVEFYGIEGIETPHGNKLFLSCSHDAVVDDSIIIENGSNRIILNEGKQSMIVNSLEEPIQMKYQSQLSGIVVDSLIKEGNCALTTYAESASFHKIYLTGLLNLYNQATGAEHDCCPIT